VESYGMIMATGRGYVVVRIVRCWEDVIAGKVS
jgi:hypothetical protein